MIGKVKIARWFHDNYAGISHNNQLTDKLVLIYAHTIERNILMLNRFFITPARSAVGLLLAGLFVTFSCFADSPLVPDAQKTPGDVLTTDASVICVKGYTKTVRNVPQAIKEQAYRNYGITSRKPKEYEIDHLISLELGGSNSIRNLWPQSYITQPLNAHVKDELENKLHELICSGQLPVEQAQLEVAQDWVAAYQKHIGPLPGGAETPATTSSTITEKPAEISPSVNPQNPINASETTAVKQPLATATQPGSPVDQPDNTGNCPLSSPIKVSKNGIYHEQGGPNYDRTHAKNCFPTPEAAQAAGFRAPKH